MDLQRFENNGITIYIDSKTGESFLTQTAYVKLSGKAKSTISERLKGLGFSNTKEAQALTKGGIQGVRLLNEDFIAQYLIKDNPKAATEFIKLGVRLFNHRLAGYTHSEPKQIKQIASGLEYAEAIAKLASAEAPDAIKQMAFDMMGDEMSTAKQLSPAAEPKEIWLGVAQLANELGYKVDKSSRALLGKFIGRCAEQFSLERKREARLCNGTMRKIWIYKDNEQLRDLIHDFFAKLESTNTGE